MSENSLLENVDIAELVQHVDIENVLKEVDLRQLLEQVDLESVLGGFGAAAGSELGTRVGRRLDTAFGVGEDDSADGSTHENDATETESEAELGASDEESTETEEEADAGTSAESDDETDATVESDDGADEPGVESDGTDAEPESRADLEALSYRDLQSLTKGTDVKGNISKDRMVEELAAEFDFEE